MTSSETTNDLDDGDDSRSEIRERTVGFSLRLWFLPELDQWKVSFSRNAYGQPILAIGPLRAMWERVTIWREASNT